MIWAFLFALAPAADPPGCALATLTNPGWREQCQTAIDSETDRTAKAVLLFRSAYAYNEQRDTVRAREALEASVQLDPANFHAWHELGYTANEVGDYAAGVVALDRAIALNATDPANYRERALARHYAGDLAGALADRDRDAALTPDDANALLARAEAALWVGRFADARRDADAAGVIATRKGDAALTGHVSQLRSRIDAWSAPAAGDAARTCRDLLAGKTDGRDVVAACTGAFFQAPDITGRAEFLTGRSLAYLLADHNEQASVEDSRVAAGLVPTDAKMQSNLGYAYVRVHHSWAAERAFDRSLTLEPSWPALAGRAVARFNQRNYDGALDDARKANATRPDAVAFTVIGDVASARGDTTAAKAAWLNAWRLGGRDDGLVERLRGIGVTDPASAR